MQMDEKDLRILLGVSRRETYAEIAKACGVSISLIQYRLNRLASLGYVQKPPSKAARSILLTENGRRIMTQYGVKQ